MKSLPALIIALFAALLIIQAPAFAQDTDKNDEVKTEEKKKTSVSIGFTAYYTWWQPTTFIENNFGLNRNLLKGNAFVYGPSLSVKFNPRWSMTFNFLYGKFEIPVSTFIIETTGVLHKLEGDLIFSKTMNKWARFYFGFKYYGQIGGNNIVGLHKGGMGFGFSFIVPIYKTFYFLPNISAMVIGGESAIATGANASASFAYLISKIRLTIAVGFRGQYLYNVKTFALIEGKDDIYFGPFVALVYTF